MTERLRDLRPWTPDQPTPPGMKRMPDGTPGPDGAVHGVHLVPDRRPTRQKEVRVLPFGENPEGYTPPGV